MHCYYLRTVSRSDHILWIYVLNLGNFDRAKLTKPINILIVKYSSIVLKSTKTPDEKEKVQ